MSQSIPMTYNARIQDITQNVVKEQIAEHVYFHYDPLTEKAYFDFTSRSYVYVKGQAKPMASTSTNTLDSDATAIMTQSFAKGLKDPVTQADLGQISVAGIMVYIKNAFDLLYNKRAKDNTYPDPDTPYPSEQAIEQANQLFDLYGSGEDGYPLGKAFGGPGIVYPPITE